MRRNALKLAGVLSLLLATLVAAIWVRSYLPGRLHVHAIRGHLVVVAIEMSDEDYEGKVAKGAEPLWVELKRRAAGRGGAAGWWGGSGIYSYTSPPQGPLAPNRFVVLEAPLWIPFAAACLLAAAWLARAAVARRRVAAGHCAACGYDLRATPEKCPECGAVPQRPSETAA